MTRKNITQEEVDIIEKMYREKASIENIAKHLGRNPRVIEKKITDMGFRRVMSRDQRLFEEKLLETIHEYWDAQSGTSGCNVNVFQNRHGEVRSDLVNGMPKYMKTSKYLKS